MYEKKTTNQIHFLTRKYIRVKNLSIFTAFPMIDDRYIKINSQIKNTTL